MMDQTACRSEYELLTRTVSKSPASPTKLQLSCKLATDVLSRLADDRYCM